MYSQLQRTNLVLYSILTKGALLAHVHNAFIEILKHFCMVGLNATTIKLGLNLQALKWTHTRVHCHKKVRPGPILLEL